MKMASRLRPTAMMLIALCASILVLSLVLLNAVTQIRRLGDGQARNAQVIGRLEQQVADLGGTPVTGPTYLILPRRIVTPSPRAAVPTTVAPTRSGQSRPSATPVPTPAPTPTRRPTPSPTPSPTPTCVRILLVCI